MGQQPKALRCKVQRAVGLPWLQTQLQSYEQGLFLVQSCSFAKIKVQEQFQALVSRCWRQKAGGVVAEPGRRAEPGGHQMMSPTGTYPAGEMEASSPAGTPPLPMCGERSCCRHWVEPKETIPVNSVVVC